MEVKIGVSDSPREIVFNSAQTPGEVEDLVQAALAGAGTSAVLVEIGAADVRRVGFGIAPGA